MKTQTIIIGQTVENQPLRKIIFDKYLNSDLKIDSYTNDNKEVILGPETFNFVELICKNYTTGNDLMFAYTNPESRRDGTLFIGKWNDGVVE